jgi:hypothetical protein
LNQIEFIERDLFKFNVKLQFVSFRSNRIKYIDPQVFDVIQGSLTQLWLDGTVTSCGLTGVTTKEGVQSTLTKLKNSPCVDESNAPTLYLYWLQMQESNNNECESDLAAANQTIADLEDENAALQIRIDGMETECDESIAQVTSEYLEQIQCLAQPEKEGCPARMIPASS